MIKRYKLPGKPWAALLGAAFFLGACQPKPEITHFDHYKAQVLPGQATPVALGADSTQILLQDYIMPLDSIDSVTCSAPLSLHNQQDTLLITGHLREQLANLAIWVKGQHYDILLKKSDKTQRTFHFKGEEQKVQIKGEFNAWNPNATEMEKQADGSFATTVTLNPGTYQYLFVVDGKEIRDPNNPDSISNGMGGWNSVISLPRPKPEELPMLTTASYTDHSITLSFKQHPTQVMAYWENVQLPQSAIKVADDHLTLDIPTNAQSMQRSFIRVWASNAKGISNEVLVPLQKGQVVNNTAELSRSDKRSMVLYFLMVDRFFDGDSTNDAPLNNPKVLPKADFKGGDIQGVTQKLQAGYFDSLGINTIWLSPITQNPKGAYGHYEHPETAFSGYHGYWPISSSKIDARFGSAEALKELVKACHAKDKNIILDYVANHVHQEHPLYKEHPEWATKLHLPDGTLNTERWDDHRLTTWFDTFLPTLDLRKPEVYTKMTDSALFWSKHYQLDGYRHDATKHIPLVFWRMLTRKLKEQVEVPEHRFVYQIGETYGSRELINSYISSGLLDAQFDFNVYDDAVQTFANDDVPVSRLINSLKESLAYYGTHNLMGYISGNQDRARFISFADGSIRFDEDSKYAGWNRDIEVKDTVGYNKLQLLQAFNMSIPGVPVIYYGDEIGIPGGNDPDNRRVMQFDHLNQYQQQTKQIVSQLVKERRHNLALIYGDTHLWSTDAHTLMIQRDYFDQHTLVIFNTANAPKEVLLTKEAAKGKAVFHHRMQGEKLTLPAYSFEIINF